MSEVCFVEVPAETSACLLLLLWEEICLLSSRSRSGRSHLSKPPAHCPAIVGSVYRYWMECDSRPMLSLLYPEGGLPNPV